LDLTIKLTLRLTDLEAARQFAMATMVGISDEHLEQGIDTVTSAPTIEQGLDALLIDERAVANAFVLGVIRRGIAEAPGEITHVKISWDQLD